jgi:protein-L-isoaspartate(D-aspartate) O-methyltransferase
VPEALADRGLEAVYRDESIVTKRSAQGMAVSSSAQPAIMARMLELLEVQPGDRVLEIGAVTGYNAALFEHLTTRTGRMTSIGRALVVLDRRERVSPSQKLAAVRLPLRCGDR